MTIVEFYDNTHVFFGFWGLGLQLGIFDHYLVRFILQEIRFVKTLVIMRKVVNQCLILHNQKYVWFHKTQLLSVITYSLTMKINPENTVYANMSDLPPFPNAAHYQYWVTVLSINVLYTCKLQICCRCFNMYFWTQERSFNFHLSVHTFQLWLSCL